MKQFRCSTGRARIVGLHLSGGYLREFDSFAERVGWELMEFRVVMNSNNRVISGGIKEYLAIFSNVPHCTNSELFNQCVRS